eukprot:3733418-Prymnesium_polylepis.2
MRLLHPSSGHDAPSPGAHLGGTRAPSRCSKFTRTVLHVVWARAHCQLACTAKVRWLRDGLLLLQALPGKALANAPLRVQVTADCARARGALSARRRHPGCLRPLPAAR